MLQPESCALPRLAEAALFQRAAEVVVDVVVAAGGEGAGVVVVEQEGAVAVVVEQEGAVAGPPGAPVRVPDALVATEPVAAMPAVGVVVVPGAAAMMCAQSRSPRAILSAD